MHIIMSISGATIDVSVRVLVRTGNVETVEDRIVEYVDHLHEHFVHPVVIKDGRYMPPEAPGYSIEMKRESLDRYELPNGEAWQLASMAP